MTSPLHIDQTQAARLIALVLREEEELSSDQANKLADQICRRLSYAMFAAGIKTSTDRIIPRSPSGLQERRLKADMALSNFTAPNISDDVRACIIWNMVYSVCRPDKLEKQAGT